MRCIRNQATLCASHDGDHVPAHELNEQGEHRDCRECVAFSDALDRIDAIPAPALPDGLLDRIMAAVALEREALDAAEHAHPQTHAASGPSTPGVTRLVDWVSGPRMWRGIAAGATVAASLVAVLVIGSLGSRPQTADLETSEAETSGPAMSLTYGSGRSSTKDDGAASVQAPAKAPDYVSFQERVFVPGSLLADSTAATPSIGSIMSAFGNAGSAVEATVYRSPLTDGSIVVRGPDGYRLYSPVVRMLNSVRFQLTTGIPIERFGTWPTLPARFAPPTAADGSPTFVPAVKDSLGVQVYASAGQPVSMGFAIAPRSNVTDPAGGNPNWTWWAPLSQ